MDNHHTVLEEACGETNPAVILADWILGKSKIHPVEIILKVAKSADAGECIGTQTEAFLRGCVDKYYDGNPCIMVRAIEAYLKEKPLDEEVVSGLRFQNFVLMMVGVCRKWDEAHTEAVGMPTQGFPVRTAEDIAAMHWLLEMLSMEGYQGFAETAIARMSSFAGHKVAEEAYGKLVEAKRVKSETYRLLQLGDPQERRLYVEQRLRALLSIQQLRTSAYWNEAEGLKIELIQLIDAEGGDGIKYVQELAVEIRGSSESSEREI